MSDTSLGGAARELMTKLNAFASSSGAAILVIHHTGRELPAAKAKSAKTVGEKIKGSAEFAFAGRFTITLHLESDQKDDAIALATGERHITLYQNNFLSNTPRLLGSLGFRMDKATGLSEAVAPPVIGLDPDVPIEKVKPVKGSAKPAEPHAVDADAHTVAPLIATLEAKIGRPVPISGAKSLYRAELRELAGWTRKRCEAAHRRTIELGKCKRRG